jgi:hypothetical protein
MLRPRSAAARLAPEKPEFRAGLPPLRRPTRSAGGGWQLKLDDFVRRRQAARLRALANRLRASADTDTDDEAPPWLLPDESTPQARREIAAIVRKLKDRGIALAQVWDTLGRFMHQAVEAQALPGARVTLRESLVGFLAQCERVDDELSRMAELLAGDSVFADMDELQAYREFLEAARGVTRDLAGEHRVSLDSGILDNPRGTPPQPWQHEAEGALRALGLPRALVRRLLSLLTQAAGARPAV